MKAPKTPEKDAPVLQGLRVFEFVVWNGSGQTLANDRRVRGSHDRPVQLYDRNVRESWCATNHGNNLLF